MPEVHHRRNLPRKASRMGGWRRDDLGPSFLILVGASDFRVAGSSGIAGSGVSFLWAP